MNEELKEQIEKLMVDARKLRRAIVQIEYNSNALRMASGYMSDTLEMLGYALQELDE